MSQRSVILQRKLHELEAELEDLFRHSPEKTLSGNQIYFDDIEQRIEFLKNLYSAEVASAQHQNTEELHETGERLTALEAAFRDWIASRNSLFRSNLQDESLSVCSDCTQALLQDDEARESESPISEESPPKNLTDEIPVNRGIGREFPEKLIEKSAEMQEESGGSGRIWGRIGRYFGVFSGGIIFGAICVGKYVSVFDFAHYEAFVDLTPT